MLCREWYYLLPAGEDVGVESFVWIVMRRTGLTGSFLSNRVPARVYCPEKFEDRNYWTGG